MLIKNQIYTAHITDYTAQGQGVAHVEGCAVFVPDAIVGEVCQIRITKAAKTWAAGQIVRIQSVSPHRVNRECPIGKRCGGCALSITNSQSSLRLTSMESVMLSSHLILCHPILLLPSIPPSIRVFSNESTLCMRWPKYWSFSFIVSPSSEHPGLISFRVRIY